MKKQRRKLCPIDSTTNRKWLIKICIVESFQLICGNIPSANRSLDGQSLEVLQRKLNCGVLWKLSEEIIWIILEYLRRIKLAFLFRVCKSVHLHKFEHISQPDASISQIYCSSFKYRSTCFGHTHVHHQEAYKLQ
jgi:hypothetical protein